jgi:hypothetical protein
MGRPFFNTTLISKRQITDLFDSIWPTATALWNLRWQVQGFLSVYPKCTEDELRGRFVEGSTIHGANLQRSCIEQTWEQQQAFFAGILLTNVFAIYEGWVDSTLRQISAHSKSNLRGLQFPVTTGIALGVEDTLKKLTTPESRVLRMSFYNELTKDRKYSRSSLVNLLFCYRYFKELRNCMIHNGSRINAHCKTAYDNFDLVATSRDLGTKEVPSHVPAMVGDPVILHLRGVVGLCDVVVRIMVTIDAELSRSSRTEKYLDSKWKDCHGSVPHTLSSKPTKQALQVKHYLTKAGFPAPVSTATLYTYLKSRGWIF